MDSLIIALIIDGVFKPTDIPYILRCWDESWWRLDIVGIAQETNYVWN
jgi:hypothetical protein